MNEFILRRITKVLACHKRVHQFTVNEEGKLSDRLANPFT